MATRNGFEIQVGANVDAYGKAIKTGVIKPTEDAQDAIDDLGKSRGPEQLERDMKGAQKATEKLANEVEDTAREIETEFRDAYRKAKRSADDFNDGAGEATREFKQEALQNFSEVTSSFDGSMSSIQDLAQGTLGGLASSGLPGIGIAAGAAAGAVGLIGAALGDAQAKQEELEEAASDWADAYIEAGGRIITAAQQVAMYNEIATDPEKYKEAQKNAELWGVSRGVALNAMAGNTWAVEEAQASLNKRHDEFAAALDDNNQKVLDESEALTGWRKAIQDGQDAIDRLKESQELGLVQADAYSEALRLQAEHTIGAKKAVDEFGDAIYSLPDGTTIYVDAETGQATQNVDAIEKKIYGLPVNTTLGVDVDTSGAERKLQQWIQKDRTIRVAIDGKSYGRY
ncbi:MAG: hypothetical protein ACTHMQ_05290 [Protaetiibacter sp.]